MPLPHYIYLDSKIVGTARQIAVFFADGIFARDRTIVLVKRYKHKSAARIQAALNQSGIRNRFVSPEDTDNLPEGVVFYPFNAQSNCRTVANRNLTHIFITHGESSKAASVKPVIRIYDYVFAAGQAGIDRFLAHGVFSQHDAAAGRLQTAGDTFVGKTGLGSSGERCIFYAPTWEGGIERENYSSLAYWQAAAARINGKAGQCQTDTVLIRPHPNTGCRDAAYRGYLLDLAVFLRKRGRRVLLYAPNLPLSWWQRQRCRCNGIEQADRFDGFQAAFALCDVSAMETQLLNEGIEYEMFSDRRYSAAVAGSGAYRQIAAIDEFAGWLALHDAATHRRYLIDHAYDMVALDGRIDFLLQRLQSIG